MRMRWRRVIPLILGILLISPHVLAQNSADSLTAATKQWLKNVSAGDRDELNKMMHRHCMLTTPAGDVLSKDRLVPEDPSKPVQKLPPMDLQTPIARIFEDTGVVMSRLKPTEGPTLNATFVFVNRKGTWVLIAAQLSPH